MNATAEKKESVAAGAMDRFTLWFGQFLSWANFLLIFIIVVQVILRYGFGRGMVALEELEWHLFAVAFMFGLSYAVVTDAHVRVDLLSNLMSKSTRAWVEIFGNHATFAAIHHHRHHLRVGVLLVLLGKPRALACAHGASLPLGDQGRHSVELHPAGVGGPDAPDQHHPTSEGAKRCCQMTIWS